ncbi:MAG TPA: hypothetical protein VME70_04105 [Mycobacteriales bacterium]|nr:hypothetical protein [Mycobacteriales bacterium]
MPHSTEAFAIDGNGTTANTVYHIAMRKGTHWHLVKAPKLNGRYGTLLSLGAGSARTVWLGGGREVGHGSIQEIPTIWRWNGHRFVEMSTPNLGNGADGVTSIAASGPNNAWAVGAIFSTLTDLNSVALHWNGKKWSQVNTPTGPLISVISTKANGTWALDDSAELLKWTGTEWTVVSTAPTNTDPFKIAQGPGKTIYAVGGSSLLKFNGTTWSKVAFAKHSKPSRFDAISTSGSSGWLVGGKGTHSVVLHSTGGPWKIQFTPKAKYELFSVSAASAKKATVVGDTYNRVTYVSHPYVIATSGHGWHVQTVS